MALSFSKFNLFVQGLCREEHQLNSDTIKVALFTASTAPAATDQNYGTTLAGGSAEVSNGNGYTTGGGSGGAAISSNSSGTETVRTTNAIPTWTASSSGFAFRYIVAYNDTQANDRLIGFWDYGSTVTLSGANADTFTANGLNTSILTLA